MKRKITWLLVLLGPLLLCSLAMAQVKSCKLHMCAFCGEESGEKHDKAETYVTPQGVRHM